MGRRHQVRFANDDILGALNVVGAAVNQSKADNTPDRWLPPRVCSYAIQWIGTKTRWGLTVTAAEHDTLTELLDGCTPATTPPSLPYKKATVVTTLPPPTTTTTLPPPSAGPANVLDDPSRSGGAPVEVPGPVRLAIELAVLGGGWVAYGIAGHPAIGAAFATLTVLHYAVARPRVQWLLSR